MGFYRSEYDSSLQYCVTIGGVPTATASGMFFFNGSFNKQVTIGNYITNCYGMFGACTNFNQPITIPSSVMDCSGMFAGCTTLSRDINIKGTAYRNLNTYGMLQEKNNSKRVNIRYNSVLNNRFNITNANSIVGAAITWTTTTNGFYNTAYNIYCYYNYAG